MQKYPIGAIFENKNDKGRKHKIIFHVLTYEKTLSDDNDDHYEITDGDALTTWTKESILNSMVWTNKPN